LTRDILPPVPQRFGEVIEFDEPSRDIPIGVIVPFDFGLDWEYWGYLPEGVSLYFTRTPHLRHPVGLELARDVGKPVMVKRMTKTLLALDPAVVVYACASGSFVRGVHGEEELRAAILEAGAHKAVSSSGAMLEALRALGAERIAIATPYTKSLSLRLAAFLHQAGFEVASLVYLGLKTGIVNVSRSTVANLIRGAARSDADAVFVSCTGLRTLGIVAELEEEIGLPILQSNQVTLWQALKDAQALPLDPTYEPGRILGGGTPMARSTAMLLEAARRELRQEAS
jgi:maleate isomerase